MAKRKYRLQVIMNYQKRDSLIFDDLLENLHLVRSNIFAILNEYTSLSMEMADILAKDLVEDFNKFVSTKKKNVYYVKIAPAGEGRYISISVGVEE